MQQLLERNELVNLTTLNPRHKEAETLLLDYYKKVKSSWSPSAIKNLKDKAGLKLTNKINRCEFARLAAVEELQFFDSESLLPEQIIIESPDFVELQQAYLEQEQKLASAEEKVKQLTESAAEQTKQLEDELEAKQQELNKSERFSFLLLTNRLLPAGKPLNGTEESPAMRILGSPKTLTELEANYRELIKREHPDLSVHEPELAAKRYMYVRSLVKFTRKHWDRVKPTAKISNEDLQRRMNATTPYSPESFWAA